MGQFLVIGIASRIVANKKEAEKAFKSIDAFNKEFEKNFNASNIYRLQEKEDIISLELRPEVAEKEWLDFIHDFYRLRYGENEDSLWLCQMVEVPDSCVVRDDIESMRTQS